ncbi:MAG: ShlB/FhaC/HecB family hemolysin secretion/activation protein [Nitrospirota bacterium]
MRFVIHGNHHTGSLGSRLSLVLVFFATAHFGLIALGSAWAQVAPPLPLPFPSPPPPLPEGVPPAPPPSRIEPPPSVLPPAKSNLGMIRVFVREIKVVGSTVFSADELAKLTAPYVNRELTSEDLEALRMAITLHYINNGYVTSGAVVPDQSMKDGVLTIQIVEGKLSRIDVEGNRWFVPGYIRKRIALGADPPLNINSLQERLQLLQTDPRFERLNAELKPGITRGESVLDVRVAERNPLRMWLEFNNYQSPSVGAELGLVTLAHQNLTGHGDIASFQYGRSEGVEPQLDARYTLPLTPYDTTIFLQYRRNDFRVIDDQFEPLRIKSRSEILGATLRQPLYRTLNNEFALALSLEHLTNNITFDPFDTGRVPFAISGAPDGISKITALRFSQEWVHRTSNQVISAFSRFSFGIDAFGATINKDPMLPSAEFFSWLGEAQWARRLDPWRIQLVARISALLTDDRLFPLEQIAVGGRYSVRGYRENTIVQDNVLLGSVEIRIPVLRSATRGDYLWLAPFTDVGRSWQSHIPTPNPKNLTSTGMGIIWDIMQGSRFEAYWGHRWNHVDNPHDNLQDYGVHVQLVVEVLAL